MICGSVSHMFQDASIPGLIQKRESIAISLHHSYSPLCTHDTRRNDLLAMQSTDMRNRAALVAERSDATRRPRSSAQGGRRSCERVAPRLDRCCRCRESLEHHPYNRYPHRQTALATGNSRSVPATCSSRRALDSAAGFRRTTATPQLRPRPRRRDVGARSYDR